MPCQICETRRPRRFCPGVRGDICTICCGSEREVTVDCPLDCEYLQDAHAHERIPPVNPDEFPNKDIRVTDQFLRERERPLTFLARALLASALRTPGAIDFDVREALESLIRTYRTLQSGLYYDSLPANPIAAAIYAEMQQAVEAYRKEEKEHLGMTSTRDVDILGILAFMQRLELDRNNGRKRGRAFIDFLRGQFPPVEAPSPSLIIP